MKNLKKFLVLMILSSTVFYGYSQKPKLAVVDFVVAGMDKTYKEVLIEQTRVAFVNTGQYDVLETSAVDIASSKSYDGKYYDKNGNFMESCTTAAFSFSPYNSKKCNINTDFVVTGSIASFGESYSITIKCLSLKIAVNNGYQYAKVETAFSKTGLAATFSEIPATLKTLIEGEKKQNNNNTVQIPSIEYNGTLFVFPSDNASEIPWSPTEINAMAFSKMDGNTNTKKIIYFFKEGEYAANICYNLIAYGYDDWYLPAKEELNAIYLEKELFFSKTSQIGSYWSSSQYNNGGFEYAYALNFDNSRWDYLSVRQNIKVRCVRRDNQSDINLQDYTKPIKIECEGVLYVSPADFQKEVPWSPSGKEEIETNANSDNNGELNTNIIVSKYGSYEYAANVCYELDAYGYDDWYLPSIIELNAIYRNKINIPGLTASGYWTSNETNYCGACSQYFKTGAQYKGDATNGFGRKSGTWSVRCVRRD